MPKFLIQANYKPEGVKGLLKEGGSGRRKAVEQMTAAFGGKVESFYYAFGDKDVFGDGSVTIISTPGHTPGHQSLLVKLPKTGAILLSGDAVHFQSNWDNRGVPAGNTGQEQTKTSMQKMADLMAKEKAKLWINHDKAQRDSLKMSPEFYE